MALEVPELAARAELLFVGLLVGPAARFLPLAILRLLGVSFSSSFFRRHRPAPSTYRRAMTSAPVNDVAPPRGQRPGAGIGSKRVRAGLRDAAGIARLSSLRRRAI